MSKNTFIPKSLHTITALSNVARHMMARQPGYYTPSSAVQQAALVLGLYGKSDVYGLQAAAVKTLEKASAPVSGMSDQGAVAQLVN